jgi:hypothetical protein
MADLPLIVFDVNETLLDLGTMERYLARPCWSREMPAGRWSPWAFEDRLGESVWCWIQHPARMEEAARC